MIKLTQSLSEFLFRKDAQLLSLIMFGHTELLTQELYNEYLEWCKTEDGKQYLKGGSKYREDKNDI